MSVTVKERFCTFIPLNAFWCVHHRNPSGLNNKVKWLLEKSKRDPIKLDDLCRNRIIYNPSNKESYTSWVKAEYLALMCIISGASEPQELTYKLYP